MNDSKEKDFLFLLIYSPWLHIMKGKMNSDGFQLYVYLDFSCASESIQKKVHGMLLSRIEPYSYKDNVYCFHIYTWQNIVKWFVSDHGMEHYRKPTENEMNYYQHWIQKHPSSYLYYLRHVKRVSDTYVFGKKYIHVLVGDKFYETSILSPLYKRNDPIYKNVKLKKLPWIFCNKSRKETIHPVQIRSTRELPESFDISYFVL